MRRQIRAGFTLVELLIVIAIIGTLVGMITPAVNAARESARRLECSNNLVQLGKAAINHASKHGNFPTGGWGYKWTGDPDRGYGSKQPGGWQYVLLAYLDQEALHDLGRDMPRDSTQKKAAAAERETTPVKVFYCPTRRKVNVYPALQTDVINGTRTSGSRVARSDYAANGGDIANSENSTNGMPTSFTQAETQSFDWKTETDFPKAQAGIVYRHSAVTPAHIKDGVSNTYLFGEKMLDPDHYTTGVPTDDDQALYIGHDSDNIRTVRFEPRQDRPMFISGGRFGSAHSGTFNMVFADGSVHAMPYAIDMEVHMRLGTRWGGLPVDPSSYSME